MVGEKLDIDFAAIDFPSDKLTIKDLRRLYPKGFDAVEGRHDVNIEPTLDFLSEMVMVERMFAAWTYDMRRGQPIRIDPIEINREDVRSDLARLYVKSGLASGEVHAKQLIRNVESQARQQAERHGGKSR